MRLTSANKSQTEWLGVHHFIVEIGDDETEDELLELGFTFHDNEYSLPRRESILLSKINHLKHEIEQHEDKLSDARSQLAELDAQYRTDFK